MLWVSDAVRLLLGVALWEALWVPEGVCVPEAVWEAVWESDELCVCVRVSDALCV